MTMKRLVLVLAAAPLLIGGIGFAISSKAVANPANLIAQDSSQPSDQQGGHGHHHGHFPDSLGLSDDQKAQLKQIEESSHKQMDAVFTDEQKAELKQAREQHRKPNLNLSDDQKAQLKTIRDNAKSQMDGVLTDQQKQQLEQMRQQRQQNRPQQ